MSKISETAIQMFGWVMTALVWTLIGISFGVVLQQCIHQKQAAKREQTTKQTQMEYRLNSLEAELKVLQHKLKRLEQ